MIKQKINIQIFRSLLLLLLNNSVLLGHEHVIVPEIHFTYNWQGKLIDTIGYNLRYVGLTGFSEVNNHLIQDFEKDFPHFQKQWLDMGTILFNEVHSFFKKGFKQEKRTAILSLGSSGGYGSKNILFIAINSLLNTQHWEFIVTPQEAFVDLVFHELLHIWINDNMHAEKSVFLEKYKNEPENVREHIHLMAIQKMVYLKLNRLDMFEMINTYYSNITSSEYKRAWHIVNDIEDYNDIINDVLFCLNTRKIS